jgi:hypothetical protein
MDPDLISAIVDDHRSRAMAAVACWLRRDLDGYDAVVGVDEDDESATLMPIVIGELCTGLQRLVGEDELLAQIDAWLASRVDRLAS